MATSGQAVPTLFGPDFRPCEDSSTLYVKYLGRMRLPGAANSANCVHALEQLVQQAAAAEDSRRPTMELTVSCSRGGVVLSGQEGEMKHPLTQIVCASTKGAVLCYAVAVAIPEREANQKRQFIFFAHAFEVSNDNFILSSFPRSQLADD